MARPRQITDAQILASMRSCVLEHGPQVSLDVVAEELDVTAPALLKRFGNRQQLMIAALRPPDHPPLFDTIAGGPDARPLGPQLEELFDDLWDFFSLVIPCATALRESGVPHEEIFRQHQGLLKLIRAVAKWLDMAHAKGLTTGVNLETAATAMLGAVQARVFTTHLAKQSFSARAHREYLKELSQLFTRSLAPTGRRTS